MVCIPGLSGTSVGCIITLGNFTNIETWDYYHHISEWESGLGTVLCQYETQVFVFRLTGNQSSNLKHRTLRQSDH